MMAYRKRFILYRRKRKTKGYTWYYRLAGEKTGHSTGETVMWKANEYVEELLLRIERPDSVTLGEYLRPYFI